MLLRNVKVVIALSQIARIWSRNRIEIKTLQTITALAFLALFFATEEKDKEDSNEIKTFNNDI
jgi:hypothetical protein